MNSGSCQLISFRFGIKMVRKLRNILRNQKLNTSLKEINWVSNFMISLLNYKDYWVNKRLM